MGSEASRTVELDPEVAVYIVGSDRDCAGALGRLAEEHRFRIRVFDSAADFLRAAPRLPSGCLLVERPAGDAGGVELIRRVREAGLPFGAVLILAEGESQVSLAVEAMKAGARDVLQRPLDPETLVARLRAALPPGAGEPARPRDDGPVRELTPRERDVLRGVLAGKTNKQIAHDCAISPRTVEAYRSSLMTKMRVTSAAALIRRALADLPAGEPPSRRIH